MKWERPACLLVLISIGGRIGDAFPIEAAGAGAACGRYSQRISVLCRAALQEGQEYEDVPFEDYVEDLKEFSRETGHTRVPRKYTVNPRLASWVQHLQTEEYPLWRDYHNSTYLTDSRVQNLAKLGFEFKRTISWDERIDMLLEFRANHGHCRVPRRYEANPSLANWVSATRQQYRKYSQNQPSRLNKQQVHQLEDIGFEWEIKRGLRKELDVWSQRIEELQAFRREHGHCRVPPSYSKNPALAKWVVSLRQNYRLRGESSSSILTDERIHELKLHGFEWETGVLKWADRLEELRLFRKEHGHIHVPKRYPDNPQLGRWLSNQRTQYRFYKQCKPSRLDRSQVDQLEKVGFNWDDGRIGGDEVWQQRLSGVREHQVIHNCIGIPKYHPENTGLAGWYHNQRAQHKLFREGQPSRLSESQVNQLEALGIHKYKDPREQLWDERIQQLREFRDGHGHCRVPQNYPKNPSLGNWVATVRRLRFELEEEGKPNRLTDEKIAELQEIGFDFSRRRR